MSPLKLGVFLVGMLGVAVLIMVALMFITKVWG
jgi:hypothetical protein